MNQPHEELLRVNQQPLNLMSRVRQIKPSDIHNNPPNNLIGGWSAEFSSADCWRDFGRTYDYWWEAAMALIELEADEQCAPLRADHAEIVTDDREIDVGIFRPPVPPETLISADRIVDALRESEHEDYMIEPCDCEDFLSHITFEQEEELEVAVQTAVAAWLDKHDLRPTWKVVDRSWTVTAGQARAEAKAKATLDQD